MDGESKPTVKSLGIISANEENQRPKSPMKTPDGNEKPGSPKTDGAMNSPSTKAEMDLNSKPKNLKMGNKENQSQSETQNDSTKLINDFAMKIGSKKSLLTAPSTASMFNITIDLSNIVTAKVAFGSGEERKYYPENPGHSKLAQVFMAGSCKGDTPNPSYEPPPLGVNKPISNLGYGIGHLLSERFPEALGEFERRPNPGTYNIPSFFPPPPDTSNPESPILAKQLKIGFSSANSMPRFGWGPSFTTPGPGSYEGFSGGCRQVKFQNRFGSTRCIETTTVTVCTECEGEFCSECGKEQRNDYYRTKYRIEHPNGKVPGNPDTVILCRKCYCRAASGTHPYWNPKNLAWLFQKCRHCSYVHAHRNLPFHITKTRTKDIKKLTAKESVLAKYFTDKCPPKLNR